MWSYRAAVVRVHDADTVALLCDLGFNVRSQVAVRLLDVSAPELSQPGGQECRLFTATWVTQAAQSGLVWPLHVQTVVTTTAEPSERQSFVRYLGTVHALAGGKCLNGDLATFLAGHPEWGHGT